MQILMIFQTYEGQTAKIVDVVDRQLCDLGHEVRRFDASDKTAPLSFDGIDRVILAAPVHERRHPQNFEIAISACLDELRARISLFLSISLKAAFPEWEQEAEEYLLEMKMRTNFEPTSQLLVAGAVHPGCYDYYESQVLSNVVLEGHPEISRNQSCEFTNWIELKAVIDDFVKPT